MSGLGRHHVGLGAEAAAERAYLSRGAEILARRHRGAHGEIDLIVREAGILVFVEVKRRKSGDFAEVISDRQWERLERSAVAYMVEHKDKTGVVQGCRFDVVLIGPDGIPRIIVNARSF